MDNAAPPPTADGAPPLQRLGRLLHSISEALRRRGLWIVFGVIGGVIGGVIVAVSVKPPVTTIRYYKATTTLTLARPGDGHNGIGPVDWSMQLAQLALLSPEFQKEIGMKVRVPPAMVQNHVQGIGSPDALSFEVTAITSDAALAANLSFAVAQGLNDAVDQVGTSIAEKQFAGASYEMSIAQKRQQEVRAAIAADPSRDPNTDPEYQAVQNHYANLFSYLSTFPLQPKAPKFEIIGAPRAIEISAAAYFKRWLNTTVDFAKTSAFDPTNAQQTVPAPTLVRPVNTQPPDADTDLPSNAKPSPIQPISLGALAGLVMGCAAVMLGEAWDDRFHSAEEAVRWSGFRTLAEVPHLGGRSIRALVAADPPPAARQALARYRSAAAMVAVDLEVRPHRRAHPLAARDDTEGSRHAPVVLITSANPAEGKSTSSAALARGFADLGLDVLTVNGDYHRSSLRKILKPVPDLVHPDRPESTTLDRTWFLDTRRRGKDSAPLVVAEISRIIERWRVEYDVIVLDTPPILATNDATEFLHLADAIVLVGRADQTTTASLERASNLLRRYQVTSPGLIVTDIPTSDIDRAYGSSDLHT